MKKFLILTLISIFALHCTKSENPTPKKSLPAGKPYIGVDALEKAGIEHLDPRLFGMLNTDKFTYILNRKDNLIARFIGGKADRIYNHAGQGPGETLNAFNIFQLPGGQIAVYDTQKSVILFFDKELNLEKEVRVPVSIRKILFGKGKYYAFGDFDKNIFAVYDADFKKLETFGIRNRKAHLEIRFPATLYMGYLLIGGEVADTSWLHISSKCKVDIIEIENRKVKCTLEWDHPSPPNQKAINLGLNNYSSRYICKTGGIYVVQNAFSKKLKAESRYDLLLFDDRGMMIAAFQNVPQVLRTVKSRDDKKLFFIDDECNISYLNVDDLI